MSAESSLIIEAIKTAAAVLGAMSVGWAVTAAGVTWRLPEIISSVDGLTRTIGDIIRERAERKRGMRARRRNARFRSSSSRARRSIRAA